MLVEYLVAYKDGPSLCPRYYQILTKATKLMPGVSDFPRSWVMLHDQEGFVRLPNEQSIYTSPPRTSLSLQPLGSYKGNDSISLQSSAGQIYLTNQRVRLSIFPIFSKNCTLTSAVRLYTSPLKSQPSFSLSQLLFSTSMIRTSLRLSLARMCGYLSSNQCPEEEFLHPCLPFS